MILRTLKERGTFLQECSTPWLRRRTSCRLSPFFKFCETKRFLRHLVQSKTSCRKCTKQKFTSSQILLYVWENRRWTCQKSSSRKGGKSISSTTKTPQRELMGNTFSSSSTSFLVPKRTRLCSKSMNGFAKVKEKMDNGFSPGTHPHTGNLCSQFFLEWIN